MTDFISVIIPTYNPVIERLNQTLTALKNQTINIERWELIIIDNNSSLDFIKFLDLSWHKHSKISSEKRQGLTFARIKGVNAASGNIIIMFDDDNVPNKDYLSNALDILKKYPKIGAIGGKSLPVFETKPSEWLKDFYNNLALRDLGDQDIIEEWDNKYTSNSPIGAGMVIRKDALKSYLAKVTSGKNVVTDRTGQSLSSGGDNDMVIEIAKSGWQIGYFYSLVLKHIIPAERTDVKYLARLLNNTNKSWVQLLESHQINPWTAIAKWSVPLRKAKAWLTHQAWKNKPNYIKWQGACGMFDGLAAIKNNAKT